MRLIKLLLVIVGASWVISYLRQGASFPLPQVLCLGSRVTSDPAYLLPGAVILAIVLWGLGRIGRTETDDTSPESETTDEFEEPDESADPDSEAAETPESDSDTERTSEDEP